MYYNNQNPRSRRWKSLFSEPLAKVSKMSFPSAFIGNPDCAGISNLWIPVSRSFGWFSSRKR